MIAWLNHWFGSWADESKITYAVTLIVFVSLLFLSSLFFKSVVRRLISRYASTHRFTASTLLKDILHHSNIISRIAHLLPVLSFYLAIKVFGFLQFDSDALELLDKAIMVYLLLAFVAIAFAIFDILLLTYRKTNRGRKHAIRSYTQVAKILLVLLVGTTIISLLLAESPLTLLTGFGALTAALMFIFKEPIIGLLASLEITLSDVIRMGDWVQISRYGVNGTLVDISLTAVKIRNFDNSISIIPTKEVVASGMKHWGAMSDSGARRIKRAFQIDVHDIRIWSKTEIQQLVTRLPLLADSQALLTAAPITNEVIFRHYLTCYLSTITDLHQQHDDYPIVVRQRSPLDAGLPIEICAFSRITNWGDYERLQSDIFSHLLSVLPLFQLKLYQRSSDYRRE